MINQKVRDFLFLSAMIAPLTMVVASADDNIDNGKIAFGTYCASCHGVSAKGGGPIADQLSTTPSDLTLLARNAGGVFPRESVGAVIDGRTLVAAHGDRDMPIWGEMFVYEATGGGVAENDEELTREFVTLRVKQLADYIGSIQQ